MDVRNKLENLFGKWSGERSVSFTPLPESGSARKYYRLRGIKNSAVGVYNPDKRENSAFAYLAKHFKKINLNVPRIYASDQKENIYLIEDLGDQTLFNILTLPAGKKQFSPYDLDLIQRSLIELTRFQIHGSKGIDYNKCYPRPSFDRQSILWDLNYFKYYFLKLAGIQFDEQKLEEDFSTLTGHLLKAEKNYFMYRDFNSRNIMVLDEELFFIDFQGGRKGPLQYDAVSFLFSSKLNFDGQLRSELLEFYIESVNKLKKIDSKQFEKYFYDFALIRILQMLGAYGYRGYFQGKAHFITSIAFAINNLESVLNTKKIRLKMPELYNCFGLIIDKMNSGFFPLPSQSTGKLTVRISSFSYRERIPSDFTGNGGGFVFDCRAIPNPGRIEKYKHLTGKDLPVKEFLESQPEAMKFLKESTDIVEQSVINYIERGWTDLMINYGCTGGQHRSVFCAESLASYLRSKYDIKVILTHTKFSG